MTALDDLTRNIRTLKELLSIAWTRLGDPLLTAFDRREARNQIKQLDAELRRNLQVLEAYHRMRRDPHDLDPGPQKPSLRFLG